MKNQCRSEYEAIIDSNGVISAKLCAVSKCATMPLMRFKCSLVVSSKALFVPRENVATEKLLSEPKIDGHASFALYNQNLM